MPRPRHVARMQNAAAREHFHRISPPSRAARVPSGRSLPALWNSVRNSPFYHKKWLIFGRRSRSSPVRETVRSVALCGTGQLILRNFRSSHLPQPCHKIRFDRYDALLALVVPLSLDRNDQTHLVEMTSSILPSLLGPEFDHFLFAPIGEERNGMLLSVVSALARLDLDPWQETAQLAQLPGATATQRLTSLIAALPDRPAHEDPQTVAAGLIALLPRRADPNVMARQEPLGV